MDKNKLELINPGLPSKVDDMRCYDVLSLATSRGMILCRKLWTLLNILIFVRRIPLCVGHESWDTLVGRYHESFDGFDLTPSNIYGVIKLRYIRKGEAKHLEGCIEIQLSKVDYRYKCSMRTHKIGIWNIFIGLQAHYEN